MKKIITEKVNYFIKKAEDHYGRKFPTPVIKFSNRMTTTAGNCRCNFYNKSTTLTFSLPIIKANNLEDFIERTVPHEVAHAIEFHIYLTMGHGSRFKFIMYHVFNRSCSQIGRTHSFKVVRKNRFLHKCALCGKEINMGPTTHKRLLNNKAIYTHSACGGKITKEYKKA